MYELLNESSFNLSTVNGFPCITIKSLYKDGIANIAGNTQQIMLTDYGVYALEKNLILLLNAITDYKNDLTPRKIKK